MHNDQRNLETIPAGALGMIPLESCREIGEKVDKYLVNGDVYVSTSMRTTSRSKATCVTPILSMHPARVSEVAKQKV